MQPAARFWAGGLGPKAVVATSPGQVSSAVASEYDKTIAAGSGGRRTLIALVSIYDDAGTSEANALALDPAGLNLALSPVGEQKFGFANQHAVQIWGAHLPGGATGSLVLRATMDAAVNSFAVTTAVVANMGTLTPAFLGGANDVSVSGVAVPAGGIAFGIAIGDESGNAIAWGASLTTRANVSTGSGGQDHRHGAAWDIYPAGRAASAETITRSNGDSEAMLVASFA